MSSDFEQCGLLRAMLGKKAQNFVATAVTPSSETKSFTLHSLRGSWIVLLFYFSDYADICTEDVLQFSSKLPDFQKANAYILGISTDPIPCHRSWIRQNRDHLGISKIRFPLVSDMSTKISKAYGMATPNKGIYRRAYFLIDPTLKIRFFMASSIETGLNAEDCLENLEDIQMSDQIVNAWKVDLNRCKPSLLYLHSLNDVVDSKIDTLQAYLNLFVESYLDTVMLSDFNLIMIELQKLVRKIGLKCLANMMLKQTNLLKVLHTQKGMLYHTVESVLAFEQLAKLSKKHNSGTQILLSLYHSLEFVIALLLLIVSMEESEKLGPAAKKAYNTTLKFHHPCCNQMIHLISMHWLQRKQDFMESNLERGELKPTRLALQLKSFDGKLFRILADLQKLKEKIGHSLNKRGIRIL